MGRRQLECVNEIPRKATAVLRLRPPRRTSLMMAAYLGMRSLWDHAFAAICLTRWLLVAQRFLAVELRGVPNRGEDGHGQHAGGSDGSAQVKQQDPVPEHRGKWTTQEREI